MLKYFGKEFIFDWKDRTYKRYKMMRWNVRLISKILHKLTFGENYFLNPKKIFLVS